MNNDHNDVVMEPSPPAPDPAPPGAEDGSPAAPAALPNPSAEAPLSNHVAPAPLAETLPPAATPEDPVKAEPDVVAAPAPAVSPAIKQESGPAAAPAAAVSSNGQLNDSSTVAAILAFLKKNNLTGTEELLKKELAKGNEAGGGVAAVPQDNEMGNALATYKSDGDPSSYDEAYNDLEVFIENSLDMYKHELALILYPVFVHMYLELVYNGHEEAAKDFIAKFGPRQESYYQEDIKKLSFVTKKDHMKGNELMENFNTSQFTVRMSRDTYTQLRQQKKHLSEKKHTLLWNVIQEHLYLDVYEGLPRSKNQIDSTAGAVTGEANRQANKSKVLDFEILFDVLMIS